MQHDWRACFAERHIALNHEDILISSLPTQGSIDNEKVALPHNNLG